MQRTTRPWFRGALTLVVLAVFGAAALISNAGAVAEKKEATKKSVRLLKSQLGAAGGSNDATVDLQETQTQLVSLPLQAGNYVLVAKTVIDEVSGDPDVECQLRVAGTVKDTSVTEVGVDEPSTATVALTAVHQLGSTGTAELSCADENGADGEASLSKITAVEVP